MNSDFMSGSAGTSLPKDINTLDDAIAYLNEVRKSIGGDVKFRLCASDYVGDTDEYQTVSDVAAYGCKSFMSRNTFRSGENDTYVLLTYN
jgi:hypothetical protein